MGKLILGIIAVIGLLDLGFNAVMSIDRQAEVASTSVSEVLERSFPVLNMNAGLEEMPMAGDDDVLLAGDVERPLSIDVAPAYTRTRRQRSRSAPSQAEQFTPGTTVITIPKQETYAFKTETIIEYPRPTAEKGESARRNGIYEQATAAYIQKNDKSSLVGATLKKPWDLIKAVGGKLK